MNISIHAANSTTGTYEEFEEPTIFDICQEIIRCMTGLAGVRAWHKEGREWGHHLSEKLILQ